MQAANLVLIIIFEALRAKSTSRKHWKTRPPMHYATLLVSCGQLISVAGPQQEALHPKPEVQPHIIRSYSSSLVPNPFTPSRLQMLWARCLGLVRVRVGQELPLAKVHDTRGPSCVYMCIPRPSYVVPFWVIYYNPLKNHNRPKKELHWSPWVGTQKESKRFAVWG